MLIKSLIMAERQVGFDTSVCYCAKCSTSVLKSHWAGRSQTCLSAEGQSGCKYCGKTRKSTSQQKYKSNHQKLLTWIRARGAHTNTDTGVWLVCETLMKYDIYVIRMHVAIPWALTKWWVGGSSYFPKIAPAGLFLKTSSGQGKKSLYFL